MITGRPALKQKKQRSSFARLPVALGLAAMTFLAACQSELYSNLSEREVNEMISVLATHGISASRTNDGKGNFGLSVDRSAFPTAIARLSEKGLPRQDFGSLGKTFTSDKLVSTPFEERARFMHALNEELSNSISLIDGVVSARVHLMVPETSPFEENRTPPRASVFIYQEKGAQIGPQLPVIKNLIVNSLDNLEYANVEVALFDDNTATVSRRTATAGISSGITSLVFLGVLALLAWAGLKWTSASTRRSRQNTVPARLTASGE